MNALGLIEDKFPDLLKSCPEILGYTRVINNIRDSKEQVYFLYALNNALNKNEKKYPKNVFLFQIHEQNSMGASAENLELIMQAEIREFDQHGLVEIQSRSFCDSSRDFERWVLDQIFFELKNLYHTHSHHGEDGKTEDTPSIVDMFIRRQGAPLLDIHREHRTSSTVDALTRLQEGNSRGDGIRKILQCYLNKIAYYHDVLRRLIESNSTDQHLTGCVEFVRQAKGEFIYGLTFANFYAQKSSPNASAGRETHAEDQMSPHDPFDRTSQVAQQDNSGMITQANLNLDIDHISLFNNAIRSIEAFDLEIQTKYLHNSEKNSEDLSENMHVLTVFLVVLTLVLTMMTYLCLL